MAQAERELPGYVRARLAFMVGLWCGLYLGFGSWAVMARNFGALLILAGAFIVGLVVFLIVVADKLPGVAE